MKHSRQILCLLILLVITPAYAQRDLSALEESEVSKKEPMKSIYERMSRYGINRTDVKKIGGRTTVDVPFESNTSANVYYDILAEYVLKPGEHYRFEIDQYVVTMRIPDAPSSQSWIVPFADTRTPPARDAVMRKSPHGLKLANLGWHYGTGVWPLYFGWEGHSSMALYYRAVSPENKTIETHATPETLRRWDQRFIESIVPAREEEERAAQQGMFLSRAGNRIYLNAESVLINGRIWVRTAINRKYGRFYSYTTVLQPDRWLLAVFTLPEYDYNANPDATTYPSALKRAIADMESMVASLRISTLNDDGAADPFVVERVEPAPLPVREPYPER